MTSSTPPAPSPSVSPLSSLPRARSFDLRQAWLIIVLGMIVGVGVAAAVTVLIPKRYTASSRVLVTSTGVDDTTQNINGRTTATINLDTEAQLVTSAAVVQAAAVIDPALKNVAYNDLVDDIAVTVPANTTVLAIAFTDSSAASAQAGANALASAYLTNRQTTAQGLLDGQVTSADDSVTTLTDKLESLSAEAARATGSRKSFLAAQAGLVKNQILDVNQQLAQLTSIQVTPGQIVTAASLPDKPSSPSKVINLSSGLALGLLLGVTAAWLRVRFRRRVRTDQDLLRAADAPCIAVLPGVGAKISNAAGSPRDAADHRRIALIVTSAVTEPAVIVVTSPLLSGSGSRLAAGVATSLAHSGTTAALLQVHDLEAGRTGSVSVTRVRQADDLVSDSGESIAQALHRVRGRHSVIVVDVPGATLDADAQTIAAHADAVLLVVDTGTRTRLVREAIAEFDSVGAPILGTVLVRKGKRKRERPPEDLAALHGPSAYRGRAPGRSRAAARDAEPALRDDETPATAFRTRAR